MLGRMHEISNIHAFEDERFLHACLVGSAAVLAVGAALGLLLFLVLPLSAAAPGGMSAGGELVRLMAAGGWSLPAWLVGMLVLFAASLALHEGVHGMFFKLLAPAGSRVAFGFNRETAMLYACAEGIVYARWRYLLIIVAPTVLVTALLAAIGIAGGYPLACFLVGALHLAGCAGDWYYAWRIVCDRAILACEDTAWGVRFLGEGPADALDEDPAEALGEDPAETERSSKADLQ